MHGNDCILIEDDRSLAGQYKTILEMEHFKVKVYYSVEDFLLNGKIENKPTIYLLDLKLPGIKGIELLKLIRLKDKISPVFIFSGANDDSEISDCLRLGADDFLLKPYNPEHMILKLSNARKKMKMVLGDILSVGLKLIPEANLVLRNGIKARLTTKEFCLLGEMLKDTDDVLSREVLAKAMGERDVYDRTVDVHISSLRRKISPLKISIETCRGQGYRIIMQDLTP